MQEVVNLLTVDLEEWFVVEALADRFTKDDWEKQEATCERNTLRLLELFRTHRVQSTWFVLGWVAEKYPDLIREIAQDGHEIACHSYSHSRVNSMDPESFRKDTEMAVEAIMKASHRRPIGYRAPSWSIDPSTPWAFEILAELGFEYDSSIFPIKHDLYGIPDGPRHTFKMNLDNGRTLYEIPATTYRLLWSNIPVAGGGFLRHSPYWYSRWVMKRLNAQKRPALVYMHPWEIDPAPPRVTNLSIMQYYRTYTSTSVFYYKLDRLLGDFVFTSIENYLRLLRKKPRIGFNAD